MGVGVEGGEPIDDAHSPDYIARQWRCHGPIWPSSGAIHCRALALKQGQLLHMDCNMNGGSVTNIVHRDWRKPMQLVKRP